MPQGSEIPLAVNISHSAHALCIVTYPDSDLIFSALVTHRTDLHIEAFFPSADREDLLCTVTVFDPRDQIVFFGNFLTV